MKAYFLAFVFRETVNRIEPVYRARDFYFAIEKGIKNGDNFPFTSDLMPCRTQKLSALHEIVLCSGPTAEFVAVIVQVESESDDSLEIREYLDNWFAKCHWDRYDECEWHRPPPTWPRRMMYSLLADRYEVIDSIGNNRL